MRNVLAAAVFAAAVLAADPKEIRLFPHGAPGTGDIPETVISEKSTTDGERRLRLVTRPTIAIHLPPAELANGTAVIVAPGGGYRHLAIDKEGHDVARWLTTLGVAGIVLKYRVSRDPAKIDRAAVAAMALDDAKRAMKIVRNRAAEFNIRPERVGFMGFSAGGNLAINLGLGYDSETRPAFLGIIYGGAPERFEFAADAPPAFILHAADDPTVPAANATRVFDSLRKNKISAELHIFAKGGHGFGIRKKGAPTDAWPDRMRDWMETNGWLKK